MKCTSYNLWPNTQGWVFLFESVCLHVREKSVCDCIKFLIMIWGKNVLSHLGNDQKWFALVSVTSQGGCEVPLPTPILTPCCGQCAGCGHGLDLSYREPSFPARGKGGWDMQKKTGQWVCGGGRSIRLLHLQLIRSSLRQTSPQQWGTKLQRESTTVGVESCGLLESSFPLW